MNAAGPLFLTKACPAVAVVERSVQPQKRQTAYVGQSRAVDTYDSECAQVLVRTQFLFTATRDGASNELAADLSNPQEKVSTRRPGKSTRLGYNAA